MTGGIVEGRSYLRRAAYDDEIRGCDVESSMKEDWMREHNWHHPAVDVCEACLGEVDGPDGGPDGRPDREEIHESE